MSPVRISEALLFSLVVSAVVALPFAVVAVDSAEEALPSTVVREVPPEPIVTLPVIIEPAVIVPLTVKSPVELNATAFCHVPPASL